MQEFDPHVLEEKPVPPPEDFSKKAHLKSLKDYQEMYQKAVDNPEEFWGEQSRKLHWFQPPTKVLEWNLPHAKWFSGGKAKMVLPSSSPTLSCTNEYASSRMFSLP